MAASYVGSRARRSYSKNRRQAQVEVGKTSPTPTPPPSLSSPVSNRHLDAFERAIARALAANPKGRPSLEGRELQRRLEVPPGLGPVSARSLCLDVGGLPIGYHVVSGSLDHPRRKPLATNNRTTLTVSTLEDWLWDAACQIRGPRLGLGA